MSRGTGPRSLNPAGAASLVALSALALSLILEPIFATNDDAAIAMIGAGFGIASRPEPHLVFAQYGYGVIVGLLSRTLGPATHGWISLFSLAGCLFLLVRAVILTRGSSFLTYMWLIILYCIFAKAMIEPQFTITSALLFVSGITYAFVIDAYKRLSISGFILVIFILALSGLIRPPAFVMGTVVVAPALLFLIWRDAGRRRIACYLSAATIFLIAIAAAYEWAAYALSDGWSQALKYNYLRAQFNDFTRVPWVAGASAYRDMGWTRNDYDIFNNWYARDAIFNLQKVAYIVQKIALPATDFKWIWVWTWLKYPIQSAPVLFSLGAQLAVLLSRRQDKFICLLIIFGEFFAACLAAVTGRPPALRVWGGIADTALIGLGMICLFSFTPERNIEWRKVLLCIAAALGLISTWSMIGNHQIYKLQAHRYRDWIDQHGDFFNGKVIVWGGSMRFEFLVTPVRVYFPLPQTMASIGALSNSPMTSATLAAMRIQNFTNTLCRDTGARLVADPRSVEMLVKFCVQHQRVTPTYRVVSAFESSALYSLEKITAESGNDKR